jgi:sugar lactone lactonase YvrE
VVPFADGSRKTVFGSLALDPQSGDLFLGEENGNRIYRLGADQRLQTVAVGLNHLLGGSALALDRQGRLVFLDYASPETNLRSETPLPPSLSWLIDEGYRGPLVFRIDPREDRPLPRRVDLLVPVLPKTEVVDVRKEPLWRLIGVAAATGDDLVFLSSVGEVFRFGADGDLRLVVRLPAGHYHRTNLAIGPDGSVFVCGGFQIRQIFRISPAGEMSTVASELGDPGGIVLDRAGALYVAETALHRIIRISGRQ